MSGKKIGLALCGGGARALCHIGILKVLEDLKIKIDSISGTSAGAIIGAAYNSGVEVEEMEEYVNSLDWRSFLLFSDLSLSKMGMINGKKVEEVLDKFLGNKTFKQAKNFCCTAVDVIRKEVVVIRSGKLKDAVRASLSIPVLFNPVKRDGKVLVDGGIIEPLPIRPLKIFKPDIIIASSIAFDSKNKVKVDESDINSRYIIEAIFNIIEEQSSQKDIVDADIVIKPEVGNFGFLDFTNGKRIIEKGFKAAEEKIPELKKILKLK
jgi:NTE family protein